MANIYTGGTGNDSTDGAWDELYGGDGNDTLKSSRAGFVKAEGGAGRDWISLTSPSGWGYLYGGIGEDFLYGGAGGIDQLYGGTESDLIAGSSGSQDGVDIIYGGDGADALSGGLGDDSIYGGNGDDRGGEFALAYQFTGRRASFGLYGGAGHDVLDGGTGHDHIDGGIGNDTLYGGAGDYDDTLYGGDGIDLLSGETGDDSLYGGDGGGTLWGLAGLDIMIGGVGGADTLYGGTESDYVSGEVADPTRGSSVMADDHISGDDGADALYGADGNDTIYGGNGDDQGGLFTVLSTRLREDVSFGLYGGSGNDKLDGGSGKDYLEGGSGNDTLYGGIGDYADTLVGGTGSDEIYGGGGGDLLDGVDGAADVLSGGAGGDTYRPDESSQWGDTIVETANGGYDYVHATGTYTLSLNAEVENIRFADPDGVANWSLGGSDTDNWIFGNLGGNTLAGNGGNDMLVGSGGTDSLYGGDGNDYLDGLDGEADLLSGGAGDDTYLPDMTPGTMSSDMVHEAPDEGIDVVYVTGSYGLDLAASIELLGLLDPSSSDGVLLAGSDTDNTIKGGLGDDTLFGEGGTDVLMGSDGADVLDGEEGDDVLAGGDGNDELWGSDGSDLLAGGEGNDELRGGDGSDQLSGSDGFDQLWGSAGSDILTGGADYDRFHLSDPIAASWDTITDFVSGEDRLWLGLAAMDYVGEDVSSNEFRLGSAAQDADDRLIYDQTTGLLWRDVDGNGLHVPELLAYFSNKPSLDRSDIVVG